MPYAATQHCCISQLESRKTHLHRVTKIFVLNTLPTSIAFSRRDKNFHPMHSVHPTAHFQGSMQSGSTPQAWGSTSKWDDADAKFHPAHAPRSLKQQLSDAAWQIRHTRIPAHFVIALVCLSLYIGSFIHLESALPAPQPETPLTSSSSRGRSLLVVKDEGAGERIMRTSSSGTPLITKPQDVQYFPDIAINSSGFAKLRPALGNAPSGESQMRAVPFQVISHYPRITYYPAFVDPERCERVVALAMKYLGPSGLAYKPGDSVDENQQVRTSTGTFLSRAMDQSGVLAWIEDKIAAVTHLPSNYGEAFNVLRYMPTQHYDSHYDTFDPKDFGKQHSQRIATFLIFLRAPEEGGETVFKREGRDFGNLTIADWRSCDDGLGVKVKPKQGDAVLFWSTTPDLELDPHSLHGACPVVKGEKWSAAKWIHEKPIGRGGPTL